MLNIGGKGAKNRVVPISETLAKWLDEWKITLRTRVGGRVARSVTRGGRLGHSIDAANIFRLVAKAGREIGKPELAPNDLRRTYAQLGYEAGVPITQISKLLGHASVATTQRYLSLEPDLDITVSDFIPLE